MRRIGTPHEGAIRRRRPDEKDENGEWYWHFFSEEAGDGTGSELIAAGNRARTGTVVSKDSNRFRENWLVHEMPMFPVTEGRASVGHLV
jgi:hypothetical protein